LRPFVVVPARFSDLGGTTVDKLLDELTSKVGLDRGTAEKVVQFLKDNAHRLPELLGSDAAKGLMDKLPGGLGGLLGGKQ
jgi:hypothetical protein